MMTAAAMIMSSIQTKNWSLEFTRFIEPIAVGFVSYGAYIISLKTISSKTGIALMMGAAVTSYFVQTPFIFPAYFAYSRTCNGIEIQEAAEG